MYQPSAAMPATTKSKKRVCMAGIRSLRNSDRRDRRNVRSPMPLEEPLMRRREEGESTEIILVVHFDSGGESRIRIARDNQADEHAVHVDLITVGRGPTAHAPAVREPGIDRRIERENVTR